MTGFGRIRDPLAGDGEAGQSAPTPEAPMIPPDPHAQAILDRFPLEPIAWPEEVAGSVEEVDPDVLRDRFRGALLWGAVGDALGRATEGRSWEEIRARYGPDGIKDYRPWRGWSGGPKGTITDDTQLTMVVAEALIAARGGFDPADVSRRLIEWLPIGRGKGKATTASVTALANGVPWHRSGLADRPRVSAHPIALAYAALRWSVPTHPAMVAATVVALRVSSARRRAGASGRKLRQNRLRHCASLSGAHELCSLARVELSGRCNSLHGRPGRSHRHIPEALHHFQNLLGIGA